MKRFKNILYVAEPSVTQDSAIARAVSLAENIQAELTFIDVVPLVTTNVALLPAGPFAGDLQAAMVAERRDALESLVAPHQQRLSIRLDVRVGKTFLEVISAVIRNGYDLVIKPAENPAWLERLFGSNDMHLLRKCPCPVWLMKATEPSNYANVIAAIDFDPLHPESVEQPLNQQILELATSLALSDFATLHLVHVWNTPAEALIRTWSDNPDEAVANYIEGERGRHQQGLSHLCEQLRDRIGGESYDYLAPRAHLLQGSARTLIPELAEQLQADLVVMGTVGRVGIAGFIIGNTAESVLDQLKCSVLALKPPGFVSPVKLNG